MAVTMGRVPIQVTVARLLAHRRHVPDAMLAHVAEAHGRDFAAVVVVGAVRVAGRARHATETKPGAGPGRKTGGHLGQCGVKDACR